MPVTSPGRPKPFGRACVTDDRDSLRWTAYCTSRRAEMCLAIPGRILEISVADGVRLGRIEFGGIIRQACLDFVPEAAVGDYVIVHVGFAISRVDRQEAERT